jgi:hypothetical protein
MNSIMRTIGGSLGGQIAASIVATHLIAGSGLPSESGFTEAFVLSAIALLVAFFAGLAIPRRARADSEPLTGEHPAASVVQPAISR